MTPSDTANSPRPQVMLTIPQVAEALGVSRMTVYKLLNSNQLQSKHVGRLRRVPSQALQNYINDLPDAS